MDRDHLTPSGIYPGRPSPDLSLPAFARGAEPAPEYATYLTDNKDGHLSPTPMKIIYRFPGAYRGRFIEKTQTIGKTTHILMNAEWVDGQLVIIAWPGTENNPEPLCQLVPCDAQRVTRMYVQFQKQTDTGSFVEINPNSEILSLAKDGKITVSSLWVYGILRLRARAQRKGPQPG